MIYKMNDPYLGGAMDRYITGDYGEDMFKDDEGDEICDYCRRHLRTGEPIYHMPSDEFICEDCLEEWADQYREYV